jgi:hypothetical protein
VRVPNTAAETLLCRAVWQSQLRFLKAKISVSL